MSRLSREEKQGRSAAGGAPIEVHVPAAVEEGVTADGTPVSAGPGETVQQAVLNHLHRLALATGHPVLATVHDERIGFAVPLRVHVDGSSEFAGEPRREGAPAAALSPSVTQVPRPAAPALPSAPSVAPPKPLGGPGTPPSAPGVARQPVWPAPAPSSVQSPEMAVPPTTGTDPEPYRMPTPPKRPVPVAKEDSGGQAKEPPVREFDSVAEAVLAPESEAVPGGAGGPVAEPMARINAAVKQGRIEDAAALAERAVAESAATLGADHPDVLRLRELSAYIAYLAGDPLRSFHLSLDLARLRHGLGDPRGAYGNVQSAAAAWRAVRDPIQGLNLGRDLIAVWTELAAGEGPAADDLDQLERARSRMGRLAERARRAAADESR
ncbi:hypothetical protein [Streptomyces colonosanans]|uniref:Tetratricopeptide repeat protein n=1 Tax=Streptomyces colonosanans TaxID=1428652 RepID=A0A1S2Q1Z8_9ACTN|nr:hypothetical protein [Streptomyces colonosanans]OIK00054.1 hypothetical protein BIV24_03270 [Streptomyces colonosanans]